MVSWRTLPRAFQLFTQQTRQRAASTLQPQNAYSAFVEETVWHCQSKVISEQSWQRVGCHGVDCMLACCTCTGRKRTILKTWKRKSLQPNPGCQNMLAQVRTVRWYDSTCMALALPGMIRALLCAGGPRPSTVSSTRPRPQAQHQDLTSQGLDLHSLTAQQLDGGCRAACVHQPSPM